jgi:hypothetical protein
MSRAPITQTSVHPLVLLSIVDHFNRVNLKQRNKRVVGALLGKKFLNQVRSMTRQSKSSIATPFPSRKIRASPAFGFWTIFSTRPCST